MKINIFKGKSTRTKAFTFITLGIIVLVLAINYLLTYLTGKNAFYVDLTPELFYTLSEEMKTECAFIDELDDGYDDYDTDVVVVYKDGAELSSLYALAEDLRKDGKRVTVRKTMPHRLKYKELIEFN